MAASLSTGRDGVADGVTGLAAVRHTGVVGAWVWALVLIWAVLTPGVVRAQGRDNQVYQWVDGEGTIHYSTGLESVPERYRSEARPLLVAPREPAPAPAAPPSRAPSRPAAPPAAEVPFTPGSPILVTAMVNGAGSVVLVLDTGADRTVISPAALARLGIATPGTFRAEIRGVTGATRADLVWVASLAVGGAVARSMPVVAHDARLPHADGLLGRDFLGLYTVTIDTLAGVVTLSAE